MNQFNFRIGNIEARTSFRRETVEIVQWEIGYCFVIVSFVQDSDPLQWEARFVGSRPLDEQVNWKHLRELIKACYEFLNKE